ncbi:hypothetical protein D9M68_958700 [compost metagenome]
MLTVFKIIIPVRESKQAVFVGFEAPLIIKGRIAAVSMTRPGIKQAILLIYTVIGFQKGALRSQAFIPVTVHVQLA